MKIPDLTYKYNRTQPHIKNHFPEFYKYLLEKYKFCASFPEKLYCYMHKINELPKCTVCQKPVHFRNFTVGYLTYCSQQCSHKDKNVLEKQSKVMIDKWKQEHNRLLKERSKTCLERYGVINGGGSKQSLEKYKETCLERYGVEFSSQYKEYRKRASQTWKNKSPEELEIFRQRRNSTYEKRYGENVKNQMYIPGVKERIYQTKKKNHTFNSSKIEEQFAEYLTSKEISYIRQYSSDVYPYACDFYFPEYDLYLEIQGNWTHGKHPYDHNNTQDRELALLWQSKHTKYYDGALENWIKRDVQKRNTAKQNNLNFIECFTNRLDDVIKIFNSNT